MFESEAGSTSVDAHVCAAAADARAPLCSGLLSALDRVEVEQLDASSAVDAAVGFDRMINRAQALRLLAVATTVRRYQRFERVDPERSAAAELGAALAAGPRSMDAEVTYAWDLTERLRRTWQRMHDGALSYGKARLLVDETIDLTTEQAQAVEERVLDKAPQRTYSQHAAAVRRAVVRVDPKAPERRRRAAERAAGLVRRYSGDGLADLVVRLPVAQVDAAYTAADAWARARKAGGDERTLDVLRAEAFVRWASSYLLHGDSTTCDTVCDPSPTAAAEAGEAGEAAEGGADDEGARPPRNAPVRHGRPLRVGLTWNLNALLGLSDDPGELLDSGEVVSADDMRDLVACGIRLRRMLVDPKTGRLVDLTPRSWLLPPAARKSQMSEPPHGQPVWLGIVVDSDTWLAWSQGSLTGPLADAIACAPQPVRDLLAAPLTNGCLDTRPSAERPSAQLAEFVALRDRHPTNPAASPTAAAAGDADHVIPRAAGGSTTTRNLHSPSRRWHVLRTVGGWRLRRHPDGGWIWTSPQGRTYRIDPYDYRRGP
jgi:hypothetical protein